MTKIYKEVWQLALNENLLPSQEVPLRSRVIYWKKFYMTHLISYHTFAGSQTGSCHCSEDQDAGSHFRQLSVRVESKSWLVLCGALCGVTAALFTAAHVCKTFTSLSASASTGQSCDWVSAAQSRVPNTAWFNPARLKCCPLPYRRV